MAAVVKAEFPGQTLYEILGVAKEATADQIKKAYFKKALQWVRHFARRAVRCYLNNLSKSELSSLSPRLS